MPAHAGGPGTMHSRRGEPAMPLLKPGDTFPDLKVDLVGGGTL